MKVLYEAEPIEGEKVYRAVAWDNPDAAYYADGFSTPIENMEVIDSDVSTNVGHDTTESVGRVTKIFIDDDKKLKTFWQFNPITQKGREAKESWDKGWWKAVSPGVNHIIDKVTKQPVKTVIREISLVGTGRLIGSMGYNAVTEEVAGHTTTETETQTETSTSDLPTSKEELINLVRETIDGHEDFVKTRMEQQEQEKKHNEFMEFIRNMKTSEEDDTSEQVQE